MILKLIPINSLFLPSNVNITISEQSNVILFDMLIILVDNLGIKELCPRNCYQGVMSLISVIFILKDRIHHQ